MRTGDSLRQPKIGDIVLFWLAGTSKPVPLIVTAVHDCGDMVQGTLIEEDTMRKSRDHGFSPYGPGKVGYWGFQEDYYNQGDLKV